MNDVVTQTAVNLRHAHLREWLGIIDSHLRKFVTNIWHRGHPRVSLCNGNRGYSVAIRRGEFKFPEGVDYPQSVFNYIAGELEKMNLGFYVYTREVLIPGGAENELEEVFCVEWELPDVFVDSVDDEEDE